MDISDSRKIIEYADTTDEDFSGIHRKTLRVDETYPYLRKNVIWKLLEFLVYRIIMTPFAFLYSKLKFHYRIVNRKALKNIGKQGYFIYSNHTLMAGDAFLPSMVSFPRKTKVVVHADNVSIPLTRHWVELSGAVPIPTNISGMRHFLNALEKYTLLGYGIQIYPEAHIWPYYTGIRSFPADSFRFPIRFGSPVFCSTVTYQKYKKRSTPRITVYVDGPFYPNLELSAHEQAIQLQNRVYETMCERAKNSNYEAIRYIPKVDNGIPEKETL